MKTVIAKNTTEDAMNVFFTTEMDNNGHKEQVRQMTSLEPNQEITLSGEVEAQEGLTITKA